MDPRISPITFSTHFHATPILPEPDLYLHTPRGTRIPAHASILASASPVLENMVMSNRIVKIHGVPYDAVSAFVGFIYSSSCSEEEMDRYGMHLLVLSHVYSVTRLKQRCIKGLAQRVTTENVVDVLQLARLCDAPDLYLKCAKLLTNHFKAVKETEGWKFLQNHDPWLELDILRFMDEHESRKKRARRLREEQRLYVQLSEAMECLEHICTEGCTHVGPYDVDLKQQRRPCSKFSTCQGLQVLIRHFATCKKRLNGGCLRCKRMCQLFRLHSSICLHQDSCKVPLCSRTTMYELVVAAVHFTNQSTDLIRRVHRTNMVHSNWIYLQHREHGSAGNMPNMCASVIVTVPVTVRDNPLKSHNKNYSRG